MELLKSLRLVIDNLSKPLLFTKDKELLQQQLIRVVQNTNTEFVTITSTISNDSDFVDTLIRYNGFLIVFDHVDETLLRSSEMKLILDAIYNGNSIHSCNKKHPFKCCAEFRSNIIINSTDDIGSELQNHMHII